jgi:hypothetical protein
MFQGANPGALTATINPPNGPSLTACTARVIGTSRINGLSSTTPAVITPKRASRASPAPSRAYPLGWAPVRRRYSCAPGLSQRRQGGVGYPSVNFLAALPGYTSRRDFLVAGWQPRSQSL